MTIDNNLFSLDFRDGVSEEDALEMSRRLGLTVVINCYAGECPSNELFVSGPGNQFELGRLIAGQPEVKGIYSNATLHVSVRSPELDYREMSTII
ncbi:hypothetical protein HYU11_04945 [Candidatus Woesearchaeota archaeon]|nr:hypothetical protein [Candidatus Woesearchaeota archaeon]